MGALVLPVTACKARKSPSSAQKSVLADADRLTFGPGTTAATPATHADHSKGYKDTRDVSILSLNTEYDWIDFFETNSAKQTTKLLSTFVSVKVDTSGAGKAITSYLGKKVFRLDDRNLDVPAADRRCVYKTNFWRQSDKIQTAFSFDILDCERESVVGTGLVMIVGNKFSSLDLELKDGKHFFFSYDKDCLLVDDLNNDVGRQLIVRTSAGAGRDVRPPNQSMIYISPTTGTGLDPKIMFFVYGISNSLRQFDAK